MGDYRCAYKILVGKPKGKRHFEELGVDASIILKFILGNQGGKVWIGFIWPRIGTSGWLL
jgi:hypothetical protein